MFDPKTLDNGLLAAHAAKLRIFAAAEVDRTRGILLASITAQRTLLRFDAMTWVISLSGEDLHSHLVDDKNSALVCEVMRRAHRVIAPCRNNLR